MARKVLRPILPFVTSLVVVTVAFGGMAVWRRAQDTRWCRTAAVKHPPAAGDNISPDLLKAERAACAVQRQRQRSMFGAVWRTGGQETAECGFELARIQLITEKDPKSEGALLAPYGITDPATFDASGTEDADRFLKACLSARQQGFPAVWAN
jgi:hypothetical protein